LGSERDDLVTPDTKVTALRFPIPAKDDVHKFKHLLHYRILSKVIITLAFELRGNPVRRGAHGREETHELFVTLSVTAMTYTDLRQIYTPSRDKRYIVGLDPDTVVVAESVI
jgi:hypothetical protein